MNGIFSFSLNSELFVFFSEQDLDVLHVLVGLKGIWIIEGATRASSNSAFHRLQSQDFVRVLTRVHYEFITKSLQLLAVTIEHSNGVAKAVISDSVGMITRVKQCILFYCVDSLRPLDLHEK